MAGQKESIFEGKTLDDAVRMGLKALGLSRAEVMITVLEEGSGGFLGLGARPYKVRVMPRPGGPPREPGERGERGRRERGELRGRAPAEGGPRTEPRRGGRGGDRERGRKGREPMPAGEPRRENRGAEREERGGPRESAAQTPAMAREPNGEDGGRRRRGRRGGRLRGDDRPMPVESGAVAVAPQGVAAQVPADEAPAVRAERRPPRETRAPREHFGGEERGRREASPAAPAIPAAELEALAVRAAEQLLGAMGFEARISARADGSNVDVTAEVSQGEELLTGRKGEVRQALQHLLNLTVNRGEGLRYHLQLEINDFWQRREAELETLARTMADQAFARGGELVTEYLNAQERRIIHVTLREDARVKTYAIGDGLIKKLAVAPADHPEAAREED
jgi:spoIIIJ-associated protein